MQAVLLQFAEDFLTSIVFVVIYLLTHNLYAAVGVAIAVGIAQVAVNKLRGRATEVMQWLSVALVIMLGGASLALDDPRFVMMKPSAVHFVIGTVMLRQGWLLRYLPEIVIQNVPPRVIIGAGYTWAALMFALGVVNIYVAASFSIETWAWWMSVGANGVKACVFGLQYVIFRNLIRRNMRLALSPVRSESS